MTGQMGQEINRLTLTVI